MTLNSVIKRIQTIALAHKQVRSFHAVGVLTDTENEAKREYPFVRLITQPGVISIVNKRTSFNFNMFIGDMVHHAADAKENEQDVVSDMLSIAEDLITQFNNSEYNDWAISQEFSYDYGYEVDNDQVAGVDVSLTVYKRFTLNLCEIPTNEIDIIPTDNNMDRTVYDLVYIATGNEGNTITTDGMNPNIPSINGKTILLVTREMTPIYKTPAEPDPLQYTWNLTNLVVGTVINPGERFLILYRNA